MGKICTSRLLKIGIIFSSSILLVSSTFMLPKKIEINRKVYAEQLHNTKQLATTTVINKSQPVAKPKPITVTLSGDISINGSLDSQIKKYGVNYPFKYVNPFFKQSDLTVVNLETCISTRGKAASKQYTFRANPSIVNGIKNSGIDILSLANNHSLDYGPTALLDTISYAKKANLGVVGAGKNSKEANWAQYRTINGKKVAIIGLSHVLPESSWFATNTHTGIASAYTNNPMMAYIKTAVKHSDYTIIMIHWNKERKDYPEDYARKLGKQFIDAGVDAVIGSHSHTLMGTELYKGKPIYYSLGNFIFDGANNTKAGESIIVKLTLQDNKVKSSIVPLKIVNGIPRPINKTYNQSIYNKLTKLSYNSKFSPTGELNYR